MSLLETLLKANTSGVHADGTLCEAEVRVDLWWLRIVSMAVAGCGAFSAAGGAAG